MLVKIQVAVYNFVTMKTIENIKKVSLVFFIITGIAHLGSSILIANDLYLKEAEITHKIMDIPFILTGLLYAFSSLRIALTRPDKSHKKLDILLIVLIILVLIGVMLINLTIPDIAQ